MALSNATIWKVLSASGSDNNGGGWVEGSTGTDWSLQASPQYALTSVTSSGSGNTVLSASAVSDMVGNIAQVISGTNFTVGFYQVSSVSVGVSITFSTNQSAVSICSGIGASGVINIGGALATVNKILSTSSLLGSGHSIYASGSESRSTVLTPVPAVCRIIGFATTLLDGGKYTFKATTGMATMFSSSVAGIYENLKFDGNSQTISAAFVSGTNMQQAWRNIEVTGVSGSSTVIAIEGVQRQISIHDNASSGAMWTNAGAFPISCEEFECYNNANAAQVILNSSSASIVSLKNFVIYSNGGDAFKNTSNSVFQLSDGVIYAQGGVGINSTLTVGATNLAGIEIERVIIMGCIGAAVALSSSTTQKFRNRLRNCFEYNNNSQGSLPSSAGKFEGSLSQLNGDPFISSSTGNFSLNQSGLDYATLKSVGFTYPRGITIDYRAVGAAQPQIVSNYGFILAGGAF